MTNEAAARRTSCVSLCEFTGAMLAAAGLVAGVAACRRTDRRNEATMRAGETRPRDPALRARAAEANSMLEQIRMRQEAYRAEFGTYADVSSPMHEGRGSRPATTWPPSAPGPTAAPWGQPPAEWTQLGVRPPSDSVWFRYEVIAGAADVAPTPELSPVPRERAADSWWIARAYGDLDGNGTRSTFEATSFSARVEVRPDPAE